MLQPSHKAIIPHTVYTVIMQVNVPTDDHGYHGNGQTSDRTGKTMKENYDHLSFMSACTESDMFCH